MFLKLSPLRSPAFLSAANVYKGLPLKASCGLPSSRLMTENGALGVPLGATGGQFVAHGPLQTLLPAVSLSKIETVMPLVVTRMSSTFVIAISSSKVSGATKDSEDNKDNVSRESGSSFISVFLWCLGYAICLTHDTVYVV